MKRRRLDLRAEAKRKLTDWYQRRYSIMTPPRRPRGEKPQTTIRYLRRQIANMEQTLKEQRLAIDDKEKLIAGYVAQLGEASDIHETLRSANIAFSNSLDRIIDRSRQSADRLSFLEGYYAKSQEEIQKGLLTTRGRIERDQPNTNAWPSPRNSEGLSAGGQDRPRQGTFSSAARVSPRPRDQVRRQPVDDPAHQEGRPVEHIEITEARDGGPRYEPFPPGDSWGL